MDFIIKNIKWVMLVSGVLTFTMFYGLFAPQAALESMFGVSFGGTLETIVVRSWCALVGLMGAIAMDCITIALTALFLVALRVKRMTA